MATEMEYDRSVLRYLARRLLCALLFDSVVCHAPLCGRATVGFSVWCRWHTDQIMYDSWEECRERVDANRRPWGPGTY